MRRMTSVLRPDWFKITGKPWQNVSVTILTALGLLVSWQMGPKWMPPGGGRTGMTQRYRRVFPTPAVFGSGGACEAAAKGISPGYISPGYAVRDDKAMDVARVGSHLVQAIKKPSGWMALFKSASRVVSREGWRGLRRRMSRSGGERM